VHRNCATVSGQASDGIAEICRSNLFVVAKEPERNSRFLLDVVGGAIARRNAMLGKQIKLPPDSVMADVCLGITVTSLYTLVGMGLIIAFM
jgi:hypothetical protein